MFGSPLWNNNSLFLFATHTPPLPRRKEFGADEALQLKGLSSWPYATPWMVPLSDISLYVFVVTSLSLARSFHVRMNGRESVDSIACSKTCWRWLGSYPDGAGLQVLPDTHAWVRDIHYF